MTEAVKVRDWLSELTEAFEADDIERSQGLIITIVTARPDLKAQVCGLADEYLEDGERWAANFFKHAELEPEATPEPQPPIADKLAALKVLSFSGIDPDRERYREARARAKAKVDAIADEGPPIEAAPSVFGEAKTEAKGKPNLRELANRITLLRRPVEAKLDEPEPGPTSFPTAKAQLWLPGVAGEVQDYFLRVAIQPSETMSLAVGLIVPTVLVSGAVIGPSGPKGCALHQTLALLGPTSSGKQMVADVTKECVDKAGAKALLGPNRFKSGSALVRFVKGHLVSLSVQDEFGAFLGKLANAKSNPCEVEINDRMREFWALGPGSTYNSPVGAAKDDDSETMQGARLSILGIGTPEEFYAACKEPDIANGFLNRIAVLEERETPEYRTDYEIAEFPFTLSNQLNKLYCLKAQRLGWGQGAKEVWEAELGRLRAETDERKRKLWSRTPEKINRAGGVFAACRFSTTVDRSDMETAQLLMRLSDQAFQRGIEEADKKRALDHAGLKREIARRLADDFPGQQASLFEVKKSFRHNTKHKAAVDDAMKDMESSGMVKRIRIETGGAPKWVYRLLEK